MFSKAVVASRLGAPSDVFEAEAIDLKTLGVDEVVLTHVNDVFQNPVDTWDDSARSERSFEVQMAALEACDLRVTTEAPLGQPAMSLREVSRTHRAGLIVVDAEDGAIFGYGTSGEITGDLVARSETPVLVRPSVPGGACGPLLSRMLFATDFSDTAGRAFATLLTLASAGGGHVDVLHVEEPEDAEGADRSAHERADLTRLGALKERLTRAGASSVTIEVAHGSPLRELQVRAEKGEYTLLVLGSRGRSGEADGVLGAVSGPLVRAAQAPVLLVPPATATQGA